MFNSKIEEVKAKLFKQGVTDPYECTNKAEEIVNSIHEYADKIEAEKETKQARYEQAWKQRNQYKQQVSALEAQLATDPSCKKKYNQVLSLFSNAEIEADIARDSYNHSISYAGKMQNQAIIADSILSLG